MNTICLKAHAKINLTLDVTGTRADGYHLLETVMQSVSLCDDVKLTILDEPIIELTCNKEGIPCDEKNIAWRAARLFLDTHDINNGVRIELVKSIPSCAGMGGGSADGAAVLVGLNELFETNMTEQQLCDLGVKIGADVPFCIVGGTKMCTGIGEIMEPVSQMMDCSIVLVKPELNISTGAAYSKIDGGLEYPTISSENLIKALENNDIHSLCNNIGNIFTYTLEEKEREEIELIQDELENQGAMKACMTGSGSTVFAIFDNKEKAEPAKKRMQEKYNEVFLVTPSNKGIDIV